MKSTTQHRGFTLVASLQRLGGTPAGAILLLAVLATGLSAHAQSLTTLYSFHCFPLDGQEAVGDLIADGTGNLYGVTEYGGKFGAGTVFEVSPDGTETILHTFVGAPTDGALPWAGLVRDAQGNLYGTTLAGGKSPLCQLQSGYLGCGTIFKLTPTGTETLLHVFTNPTDAAYPFGRLLLDQAGNLYGTVGIGGAQERGAVFRLSANGQFAALYSFAGPPDDGQVPEAGLIRDAQGNLYGTTFGGGGQNFGTVFELSKSRSESVLYSFAGPPDATNPASALTRDSAGNLYGTTPMGGVTPSCQVGNGCGTVFKLTPSGEETVLYAFTGGADGAAPYCDLVLDSKGNLYGTTSLGGTGTDCDGGGQSFGCGVIFEIAAGGQERTLYDFAAVDMSDGAMPNGGLLHLSDGLYGTTAINGASGCGTVFKFVP